LQASQVTFKEYAHGCDGCNDISLANIGGKLSGFHNSMMVGPGYFQTVCQKLNGLRARGSEDQKTSSGGTETSNHPKNIFHRVAPLICSDSAIWQYDASRGLDAGKC
jgi:hypothetical protein